MNFNFSFDFWTLWGLCAQTLFFGRFVLQWHQSEKAKKVVMPTYFWHLSLLGAAMFGVYALVRQDIVFIITAILQLVLYGRNLVIAINQPKEPSPFVSGNLEDKYHTKNPVSKLLMNHFLREFTHILDEAKSRHSIKTICEVGCGEGELLKILHQKFPDAKLSACDIANSETKKAKTNTKDFNVHFTNQNAEKLSQYTNKQFDLVICCEVLEHLENPQNGISELNRIAKFGVTSVPLEPLWSLLNLFRLKYISSLGNTPGHLNNWSSQSFMSNILNQKSTIILKKLPLPWQMYLLKFE